MLKMIASADDSEWIFRTSIQLFKLGGAAFPIPGEFDHFKQLQMRLVEVLRECRDVQLELNLLVESHARDLELGTGGVAVESGHLRVLNDIEPRLNRLFKDFFIKSRTALYHLFGQKNKPESVTKFLLGHNMSFVQVSDDSTFERYAATFLEAHQSQKAGALIEMLRGDRASWLRTLIGTRDRMIHDVDCPTLKMNYGVVNGKVVAGFPTVSRCELRSYLQLFWENLYQAIEETIVLCLAIRMPENIVPMRIPIERVNPKLPIHWTFGLRS